MDSASSRAIDALERRVAAAIRERGFAGRRLLVAVSGGPDSLALLNSLYRLRCEYRLTLCGAHLNHKLRGAESDADADFVANAFETLGIPCTVESADVAAYRSKHRLSLEDAARRLRYAFLASAAQEREADAIALGHTADDQAETVLMHVIRGSGLNGLRGMKTLDRRAIDGRRIALFRPLLGVRRLETLAYCRALGLQPRIDPSNQSPEFLRNRVRLELLPLLERLNPSVRDSLLRLASNAAQDGDYIGAQVDEAWDEVARVDGGAVRLDAIALSGKHEAIRRHILMRAIEAAGGEVTQRHVLDMLTLIGGAPGKTLHLSGGLTFASGYGEAYIGKTDAVSDMMTPLRPIARESRLAVPGETLAGGWRISAAVIDGAGVRRVRESLRHERSKRQRLPRSSEILDLDSVGDALWVRGRRQGDRFQPLGTEQSKSLREFMVDARIPRRWRDGLPLIVSSRGVACVPGWRIAHWARVTGATKRVLRLSLSYSDSRDAREPHIAT